MKTILTNENIDEVRKIIFEKFHKKFIYVNEKCIGVPEVSKVKKDLINGKTFKIETLHNIEYFSIGDKIEIGDDYVIIHQNNELCKILKEDYEDAWLPIKIEIREFDGNSYQNNLIDEFISKVEYNFSTNLNFGKSMIGYDKDEDPEEEMCYDIIKKVKTILQKNIPLPNFLCEMFILKNNKIVVKIDWKDWINTGTAYISGTFNGHVFEDLVELYLKSGSMLRRIDTC